MVIMMIIIVLWVLRLPYVVVSCDAAGTIVDRGYLSGVLVVVMVTL